MEYFGSSQQRLIKEKEIIKIRTNNTMMMGNLHQVQIVPNTNNPSFKLRRNKQGFKLITLCFKMVKMVNFTTA